MSSFISAFTKAYPQMILVLHAILVHSKLFKISDDTIIFLKTKQKQILSSKFVTSFLGLFANPVSTVNSEKRLVNKRLSNHLENILPIALNPDATQHYEFKGQTNCTLFGVKLDPNFYDNTQVRFYEHGLERYYKTIGNKPELANLKDHNKTTKETLQKWYQQDMAVCHQLVEQDLHLRCFSKVLAHIHLGTDNPELAKLCEQVTIVSERLVFFIYRTKPINYIIYIFNFKPIVPKLKIIFKLNIQSFNKKKKNIFTITNYTTYKYLS